MKASGFLEAAQTLAVGVCITQTQNVYKNVLLRVLGIGALSLIKTVGVFVKLMEVIMHQSIVMLNMTVQIPVRTICTVLLSVAPTRQPSQTAITECTETQKRTTVTHNLALHGHTCWALPIKIFPALPNATTSLKTHHRTPKSTTVSVRAGPSTEDLKEMGTIRDQLM